MSRQLLQCIASLAVCAVVVTTGRAQTIGSWDFGTMNFVGQNTGPQFAPTVANPNVMIANITIGSANINQEVDSPVGQNNQTYPTAPFNRVFTATVVSATEADSIANNAYVFFTVTPNPGFALNLTGFSTQVGRGGLGGNRATYIYDSVDGFTAGGSITNLVTVANDATLSRPNSTTIMADLTAGRYQNLTAPIEFRFYLATDGGGQSMDFDNVVLTGNVIVVPEPACALALAAGAGGLCMFRRRRIQKSAQASATVTSRV